MPPCWLKIIKGPSCVFCDYAPRSCCAARGAYCKYTAGPQSLNVSIRLKIVKHTASFIQLTTLSSQYATRVAPEFWALEHKTRNFNAHCAILSIERDLFQNQKENINSKTYLWGYDSNRGSKQHRVGEKSSKLDSVFNTTVQLL